MDIDENIFDIIKTAIVCDYLDGREVGCAPYSSLQSICGNRFEEIAVSAYKEGYVRFSTPQEGLNYLTIPDLKNILRANNLKLSGKKGDLLARIINSLPEKKYADVVPQVNILTDAGHDLVDANYIFIKHRYELDAQFCSDVIDAALLIGCQQFSRENYVRIFRFMNEERCVEDIKNGNWGELERRYYNLSYLLATEEPGGDVEAAEKYAMRAVCISLSGMTDDNLLNRRDMAFIDGGSLDFFSDFRFRYSKKKDDLIRDFISVAKEMFQLLPFSYFYPAAMVLIFSDAIQRKRSSDFEVAGKKKYASLWRVPDPHATSYHFQTYIFI